MSEKKSVVSGKDIKYEGIFSVGQLYAAVNDFMSKRGYSRKIGLNAETVKPTGKFIKTENNFKRMMNDYCAYLFELTFQLENIKDVEVVREGVKIKMNKGKVLVEINSFIITDYESYWEKSPLSYFFRNMINKFFIGDIHHTWESDVKRDTEDLVREIGAYFNLQEFHK